MVLLLNSLKTLRLTPSLDDEQEEKKEEPEPTEEILSNPCRAPCL